MWVLTLNNNQVFTPAISSCPTDIMFSRRSIYEDKWQLICLFEVSNAHHLVTLYLSSKQNGLGRHDYGTSSINLRCSFQQSRICSRCQGLFLLFPACK